jgi:carboxypeptidase C (cathepsin A)
MKVQGEPSMTNEDQTKNDAPPPEQDNSLQKDLLVETKHTITLDGVEIPYTVTCGTIVLKEESVKEGEKEGEAEGEKPKATIFFIAYTRDDVLDKSVRPVTFSFNGGPGSSSVWLHLGVLGPRRVVMGDADNLLPPPYHLEAWVIVGVAASGRVGTATGCNGRRRQSASATLPPGR